MVPVLPISKLEKRIERAPALPERDQFAVSNVVFLVIIHAGALVSAWYASWAAAGICLLLHAICAGLGISVGYHRLLTHRSFKCPRALEYMLALLGCLCLESAPIYWVAQHRQHHQYPDQPGDPHSARKGFWWSHILWIAWIPSKDSTQKLQRRYAPDLVRVPFYQLLSQFWFVPSMVLAILLYLIGGVPFVMWGLCVRLVLCYHATWLVNSASHRFGYRTFPLEDLSTNCWWVALLAFGEGWHNNHHAFPTSARHGLKFWEIDSAYGFILLLKAFGLVWDIKSVSQTSRS